jgi:hypothetical protein
MKFLILLAMLLMNVVWASDLNKEHLLTVLDQMKKEGIVPSEEATKVEEKIKGLTEDQLNQIRIMAGQISAKNPLMIQPTTPTLQSAASSVDTESKEFKEASEKLKKIIEN